MAPDLSPLSPSVQRGSNKGAPGVSGAMSMGLVCRIHRTHRITLQDAGFSLFPMKVVGRCFKAELMEANFPLFSFSLWTGMRRRLQLLLLRLETKQHPLLTSWGRLVRLELTFHISCQSPLEGTQPGSPGWRDSPCWHLLPPAEPGQV
jgi:hypothetical protein